MSYANFSEFIVMGGYGAYVWSSFGLCAFAILLEWWSLRRQRQSALVRLREALQHHDQHDGSIEGSQP